MTREAAGLKKPELEMGLAKLEEAARSGSRQTGLLQKAQAGTITDSEREELVKSLSGASGLAAEATNGLQTNPTLQKSLDVSDFLREQHGGVVQGLGTLANSIEKGLNDERSYRMAIAGGVLKLHEQLAAQGEMIKSLTATVQQLAGQPARGPKSQVAAQQAAGGGQGEPLNKSFAGQQQGNDLQASVIQNALDDMLEKGETHAAGEDLLIAATKFEGSKTISKALLAHVTARIGGNPNNRSGRAA